MLSDNTITNINHFLLKKTNITLTVPIKHKYTNEIMQRWSNHEPSTNRKIIELINKMDDNTEQYILDAGSHVGDTLFMISKLLDYNNNNVKVIGIEPDIEKVEFINTIIKLNNITNIILYCSALSDFEYNFNINKSKSNSGAWNIYEDNKSKQLTITLDHVCKDLNMYLIHLDLEGYEYRAIMGAKNILDNVKHFILEFYHCNKDELFDSLSDKFILSTRLGGDVHFTNMSHTL
jgi:FkbM family methyltransferase